MPNTYRSYQEFYSAGPYASYLVEHRLAGSSTVRLLHGEFPDPPLPEFILYVAVRGARELSFDWGFGRWIGAWHPHDVSIAPPDIGPSLAGNEMGAPPGLGLGRRGASDRQLADTAIEVAE